DAMTPEDAAASRALLMDSILGEPAVVLEQYVSEIRTVRRYKTVHEAYLRMASGELAKDPSVIEEHARLSKTLSERRLLNRI
ncbi:MAG: hypothetical protein HY925_15575, partial [Elusimicrobia bacterium]|nr:hypothetical protein [Elusimicrobiota bacterium]